MARSRLSELAKAIADNTAILEEYYQKHGLAVPSFEVGTIEDTTIRDDETAEQARIAIIEDSTELSDLVDGPTMQIRPILNGTSMQAIYKYRIPGIVPLEPGSQISYEDIARQCRLDVDIVRRFIRFAIVHHHIFQEKQEGYVSHSAASKLLADSEDAMASIGMMFDEAYQSYAQTVKALETYTHQSPSQCGWTIAHQSTDSIWEAHAKNPALGERTSRAMRQFSRGFGHDTISLLKGWDWKSLDAKKGLVVDLGGANGHASVLLAQNYPNLRFEVQDLPHVIKSAIENVPIDLRERIALKAHSFKNPQATQADAYLFRQILHDWPDTECVAILRALIPALKPGACVVINDFVVPPPGTASPFAEKHLRAIDMIVLSLFGGRERERTDWENLFREADPRFSKVKISQPPGSCVAIIESTWAG